MKRPAPRLLDAETRQDTIRRLLDEEGIVRVADLAHRFGVSEMTVRRDLEDLEQLGVVRRIRGGARPVGPQPFRERHRRNARAKAKIAEKLQSLIPEIGSIAFDASTTVLALASRVEGARRLTVVTNSIETFQVLDGRPGIEATLTGGVHEPTTGSLVGPLALAAARVFGFARFFTSAAAVDPTLGATEDAVEEAEVKRAIAEGSTEVVLAVDSSKLGHRSVARTFELGQLVLMVTELDPADPLLDPYRSAVELL